MARQKASSVNKNANATTKEDLNKKYFPLSRMHFVSNLLISHQEAPKPVIATNVPSEAGRSPKATAR
jgi:hypothetical protein